MPLAVSCHQQRSCGAVTAVWTLHWLNGNSSGSLAAVVSHAAVPQQQFLVVRCVAAVGALMQRTAVCRLVPSKVPQPQCREGALITTVQRLDLFVYFHVL